MELTVRNRDATLIIDDEAITIINPHTRASYELNDEDRSLIAVGMCGRGYCDTCIYARDNDVRLAKDNTDKYKVCTNDQSEYRSRMIPPTNTCKEYQPKY